MAKVRAVDVEIRKFAREDIEPYVRYWTENSEAHFHARGDTDSAGLEDALRQGTDLKRLAVILLRGRAIGVHSLTDFKEGESAVFHAHIWNEASRGSGVAFFSTLKASEFFLTHSGLKKLIFNVPLSNPAVVRLAEKLGLKCLDESETRRLYEVDLAGVAEARRRLGF